MEFLGQEGIEPWDQGVLPHPMGMLLIIPRVPICIGILPGDQDGIPCVHGMFPWGCFPAALLRF